MKNRCKAFRINSTLVYRKRFPRGNFQNASVGIERISTQRGIKLSKIKGKGSNHILKNFTQSKRSIRSMNRDISIRTKMDTAMELYPMQKQSNISVTTHLNELFQFSIFKFFIIPPPEKNELYFVYSSQKSLGFYWKLYLFSPKSVITTVHFAKKMYLTSWKPMSQ